MQEDTPENYKEAINHPNKNKWIKAMKEEFQSQKTKPGLLFHDHQKTKK